jgi:hypothetical protein
MAIHPQPQLTVNHQEEAGTGIQNKMKVQHFASFTFFDKKGLIKNGICFIFLSLTNKIL